jgi:hypothetical protein
MVGLTGAKAALFRIAGVGFLLLQSCPTSLLAFQNPAGSVRCCIMIIQLLHHE